MKHFIQPLLILTVFIGLLTACTGKVKRDHPPNILLILTDQQSANDMSCTGNQDLRTPAMDELAASGIRFAMSYCTAPVCSPSKSSMITGKMPHQTGVNYNDMPIRNNIPNMGQIFSHAGYNTYWAGKWHLPESYPLRSGAKDKIIPGFKVLSFYDSTKNWPEWGRGDTTDPYLSGAVVKFIKSYHQNKPFLMVASFCNPHDICYVARKKDAFPGAKEIKNLPPLPDNFEIPHDEPGFVKQKRNLDHYGEEIIYTKKWTRKDWQVYRWNYFRLTERVDREIGKIVNALKEKKLLRNTLIVFTSDHGDGQGAHRWAAKENFYEESTNVPLIISWTGHIPGNITDNENVISGINILPTICDYAGVGDLPSFTGKSLRPLIENKSASWQEYVMVELADDPKDTARYGRMIRTPEFKYAVYSTGENREQFFNLNSDPGEMHNMAGDAMYKAEIENLRKIMKKEFDMTNDKRGNDLMKF